MPTQSYQTAGIFNKLISKSLFLNDMLPLQQPATSAGVKSSQAFWRQVSLHLLLCVSLRTQCEKDSTSVCLDTETGVRLGKGGKKLLYAVCGHFSTSPGRNLPMENNLLTSDAVCEV